MTTILLAILVIGVAFALIAIRILLVKGGEFRGTCSTNNPFLKQQGIDCPVCGAKPGEECKKDESKTPEGAIK